MHGADYWIDKLQMQKHPEGGYFTEVYRSEEQMPQEALPERFKGDRSFSTSIYFLLNGDDFSAFHRIKSDELWHFYEGVGLEIYILNDQGLQVLKLGSDPEVGESFQQLVPANCWFASKVSNNSSYALVGCTVAPGFDFKDFELAESSQLIEEFPIHKELIISLTN